MADVWDDAMLANFAAIDFPSVAGTTPSASPSNVIVGTVMAGCAERATDFSGGASLTESLRIIWQAEEPSCPRNSP